MPLLAHVKSVASKSSTEVLATRPFRGFAAPTSNTTFTPNQFFDVCLPNASRGVVRLVAYVIRKTLGWCDAEGNPQEERIRVSYQDLVNHAGISREMIRQALDEAVASHFIRCTRPGRAKGASDAGQTALYELCWDDSAEYVKDPQRFRGFFEGEGNRTDIPNEFFDRIIPHESLAVVKTVGAVIRFSIGFQARRGIRRQHVQLSYSDIQRYAHIRGRATLSEALTRALHHNYIQCLEQGIFDPNAGRLSRAAVYAVKWADGFGKPISPRIDPGQRATATDHRSEIRTGDQSEIRTGNGQKSEPEDRSEFRTGIEMKQENETFKQQDEPVAAEMQASWQMLKVQGFDAKTARALATRYPQGTIEQQIRWLGLRSAARNPLGMLRRAIEENWPDPAANVVPPQVPGAVFAAHYYAALSGNDGEPVAVPSANDVALGEHYLAKLADTAQKVAARIDHAAFGRSFARMVANVAPGLARNGVSFATALRLYGDGFWRQQQSNLKARRAAIEQAAREAHEAKHHSRWLEYLRTEADRMKNSESESYARFESHRTDERQRMIESRWVVFSPDHFARFDGEERRLLDFQAFFARDILNFWAWDAQLNPQGFTDTSTSVAIANPTQP